MPTPQHTQAQDFSVVASEKILKIQSHHPWQRNNAQTVSEESSGQRSKDKQRCKRQKEEDEENDGNSNGNECDDDDLQGLVNSNSNNCSFTSIDSRYHTFLDRRAPNSYTSSFLRPGSRFSGCQQSGRSVYEVYVDIKHIDIEKAFICGYLKINGLTDEHPQLITYFEGEIISDKYSFFTNRAEWGANKKIDIDHWKRFEPWKRMDPKVQDPNYVHTDYAQQEHLFMRWKECFLVPDHRVKDIQGASYAGFYYICFDQIDGSISGYYYHSTSDMYQQLNLTHIGDNGCLETYEFR